jgi:hypothetical protein
LSIDKGGFMILSNGEIFVAFEALKKLFEVEFPVCTGLELSRLIGKLKSPYEEIARVKDSIVRKYGKYEGERDTENPVKRGSINVKSEDDNWESFMEEYVNLMADETKVNFGNVKIPIKIPEKVNGKAIQVKLEILSSLKEFIEVG